MRSPICDYATPRSYALLCSAAIFAYVVKCRVGMLCICVAITLSSIYSIDRTFSPFFLCHFHYACVAILQPQTRRTPISHSLRDERVAGDIYDVFAVNSKWIEEQIYTLLTYIRHSHVNRTPRNGDPNTTRHRKNGTRWAKTEPRRIPLNVINNCARFHAH